MKILNAPYQSFTVDCVMLLECKPDIKTKFSGMTRGVERLIFLTFFRNVGTCLAGDIANSSEH